jgi:hypothetical protein
MKHQTPAFQPYFAIYRQGNRASARQLQITRSVVQSMVNIAAFDLDMFTLPEALRQDPIHIELALRSGRNSATEFHPISGFPRLIPGNEDAHLPRKRSFPARLPLTYRGPFFSPSKRK